MTLDQILQKPDLTAEAARAALEKAVLQTRSCLPEFAHQFKGIFSTYGFYTPAPNEQWTNGFWTGELWLAWEHSGNACFDEAARWQVRSFLERILANRRTDTHDLGFLYSLSCVAGYKLTGDETARRAALLAADKLAGRFHEKGQFIQAWGPLGGRDNYRLIIDCLLNLPLLYWASETTGSERYAALAHAHLNTAMRVLVRPDGSAYHTYYFDPDTGAPLRGETHQGYSADSAWARGQAWGVYGLALSYRYTKDPACLALFERVASYFAAHLPQDLIPYWDFVFTDGSAEPRDSSALAIAVCGMLEMAQYLPPQQSARWEGAARRLLKALIDRCAVTSPEASNGQLLHGVYGKKTPYNDCRDQGVDECNLWGDYFYVEALTRATKRWNPYW